MLALCSPVVEDIGEQRCVVRIPLNRLTRNHLNSMYLGVLAVGADLAGGLLAMRAIRLSQQKISLVFKDIRAEFLKRAEDDVLFTCEDGAMIHDQVRRVIESGQRITETMRIVSTVPSRFGSEPVATFELGLSLKPLT
jgi:acyl-coenzyme A thioesterase PaaI-like protein